MPSDVALQASIFAMRRRIGGMQWEELMSSIAETTGLAPLRAKSGWIVALGVVYVIAGLIALGSVVFATVVTVFIVGVLYLSSV